MHLSVVAQALKCQPYDANSPTYALSHASENLQTNSKSFIEKFKTRAAEVNTKVKNRFIDETDVPTETSGRFGKPDRSLAKSVDDESIEFSQESAEQ
jgi:hypothetical protein